MVSCRTSALLRLGSLIFAAKKITRPFYSNSTFECDSNIVELHIAEMLF